MTDSDLRNEMKEEQEKEERDVKMTLETTVSNLLSFEELVTRAQRQTGHAFHNLLRSSLLSDMHMQQIAMLAEKLAKPSFLSLNEKQQEDCASMLLAEEKAFLLCRHDAFARVFRSFDDALFALLRSWPGIEYDKKQLSWYIDGHKLLLQCTGYRYMADPPDLFHGSAAATGPAEALFPISGLENSIIYERFVETDGKILSHQSHQSHHPVCRYFIDEKGDLKKERIKGDDKFNHVGWKSTIIAVGERMESPVHQKWKKTIIDYLHRREQMANRPTRPDTIENVRR